MTQVQKRIKSGTYPINYPKYNHISSYANLYAQANLTAMPYAQARRLLFEGKRCVGVEYTHEGEVKEARANVEVIVSGNTNAPTLMIAEKAADMIKAATNGSHS